MKIFKKVFPVGLVMSLIFGFNLTKTFAGGRTQKICSEVKVALQNKGDMCNNSFSMQKIGSGAYRLKRSKPVFFTKSPESNNEEEINTGRFLFSETLKLDDNGNILEDYPIEINRPVPLRCNGINFDFYK